MRFNSSARLRLAPPRRAWLAAVLLLAAAACGRGGPAPASPTPGGPTSAATAGSPAPPADTAVPPTATTIPTATPTPVIISVGLAQAPSFWDPANAADEGSLIVLRHVYEGLTRFEPGTTRPEPALAEAWSASADGLTWTFRLRAGVRFSDGTPFTAEAARLNLARWLAGAPPGQYPFWRALFGGFANEADTEGEPLSVVAGVAAPDDLTLVLTLNRPYAALPNSLALTPFGFVSPAALAAAEGGTLPPQAAGTGPYVLAEWSEAGLVRLARNPDYWGAPAGPDQLIFKVIADETQRLLALNVGEADAVARLRPSDYAAVEARVAFDPALNVLYLGFNQAHAPWRNLECRLAVAHALNRPAYVQAYFPGDAEVAEAMQPPSVWGYSAPGTRAYDPDLAQQHWQACAASGVTLPPSVTLYVPPIPRAYLPDPAGLGAAIQADLQALGLNVTVASPDWQTAWLPDVYAGRADLFVLGASSLNGDPDSFLCPLFCGLEAMFNSGQAGVPLPPDEELAALLQQARTVADPAAREALYAQAHARIFETVPAVPLAHRRTAWGFHPDLQGYTPSPIESVFFNLHWAP